jgi:prepilin-type N-terminal cleavage/methylation domain-containing protein
MRGIESFFMNIKSHKAGFTLVELLIGIVLIGMILGGLSQVLGSILSTYNVAQTSQESVPQARYALGRMVMFVQESDQITTPATITPVEQLTVSERVSDQYINAIPPASSVYDARGDGLPDADKNKDGLINDNGTGDGADEFITFYLDKANGDNWKLREKMPDYSTANTGDFKKDANGEYPVICEHVKPDPLNNPLGFSCRRLSAGIVEILLTVPKGSTTVTLKTTARARWVE